MCETKNAIFGKKKQKQKTGILPQFAVTLSLNIFGWKDSDAP